LFAVALSALGAELEGKAEEIFEGVTMLLAAGILTLMIFWMQNKGAAVKTALETGIRQATDGQQRWGLFLVAFIAVMREGIELALFLVAAVFVSSALETIVGALIGLAIAVLVGLLIFVGAQRLDVRRFFAITSTLLIFVAAGMVGSSAHELNEAGILPSLIDQVWSTRSVLSETSPIGVMLKALFGYSDQPALIQILAYAMYLVTVGLAVLLRRRRRPIPLGESV
jgi:high-affinity iron transporter